MSNVLTVAKGQPVTPLKWYEFSQNNSGGWFQHDENAGIGVSVWVQARNYQEANSRAEAIGLYFDGQGDCSCCGDRWSDKWDEDGQTEEPTTRGYRRLWDVPTYAHRYDGTFYEVPETDELGNARKELN